MKKNMEKYLLIVALVIVLFGITVAITVVTREPVKQEEPKVTAEPKALTATTLEPQVLEPIQQLVVRLNSQESIYGEELKELGWTVEGDMSELDAIKVEFNECNFHDVGEYPLNGRVEIINNSKTTYDVSVIGGTYTINKRPITIIVDNQESTYAQELNELTYSVINSIEGDNLEIEISTEAEGKDVGTYPIIATVNNPNYIATIENAIYTKLPEPIKIFVDDKESIEGEELVKLTGRIKGKVLEGDKLGLRYRKAKGLTPGKYRITAKISNLNYILVEVEYGEYIIKEKPIVEPPTDNTGISEEDPIPSEPVEEEEPIYKPTERPPIPGEPTDDPDNPDDPDPDDPTPGEPGDPEDPDPDDPTPTPGDPDDPTPGDPDDLENPDGPIDDPIETP